MYCEKIDKFNPKQDKYRKDCENNLMSEQLIVFTVAFIVSNLEDFYVIYNI